MRTIFRNIEELRDYISVDVSSTLDVVMPYLIQAEKYVREITGDDLFDELVDYVHEEDGGLLTNITLELLLPKARYPLANFGYMLAVDKLNINVGNTGITVTVSNNLEPASQWRVEQFKKSLEESGNEGLEQLIAFLEKHEGDYPSWKESEAYSYQKRYFVNNAREFREITEKKISRLEFLQLKEYIKIAEEKVRGILCDMLFFELKEQYRDGSLSIDNDTLLKMVQPVICYEALSLRENTELYRGEAEKYKEALRLYLNRNAGSYPSYYESECYSSSSDDIDWENSCVYGFGI